MMNEATDLLQKIPVEKLQEHIKNAKTWRQLKKTCGLPLKIRPDVLRKCLDEMQVNYDNLPKVGENGMRKKSNVWHCSDEEFIRFVKESKTWSDVLKKCGFEGLGNIVTVQRRIKELKLNSNHLKKGAQLSDQQIVQYLSEANSWKEFLALCGTRSRRILLDRMNELNVDYSHLKKKMEYSLGPNNFVPPKILMQMVVAEKGHKCEVCNVEEWGGYPVSLVCKRKDGKKRNNVLENLILKCQNCNAVPQIDVPPRAGATSGKDEE